MATSLDLWFDAVLSDAPGVLPDFARDKIRDAAIYFCERSLVWLGAHDPIDAVANKGAYAFAPPAGQIVVKPALVWYDGHPLLPKNKDELAAMYTNWTLQVDVPRYYLGETPDTLVVVPMPSVSLVGGLTSRVHYKPSRASDTVPDWLFEDYKEAIQAGALARLKVMPNKPYSDPQGAVVHAGFFDEQIAKAKERALKGLGRARPSVKASFF